MGHVSPDQLVAIIERIVEWNFNGKLPTDVRKLRTAIHWVEERYAEGSQKPGQESHREQWGAVLKRIANLRARFDNGDFLLRLKIGTGQSFEFEWEQGEEGRVYGYQKRLRALASEVVDSPHLMTNTAWAVVTDEKSGHTHELIRFMGQLDKERHFLLRFESEVGDRVGNWRFGHYCFGLYRTDPAFVENYLDQLCEKPGFLKSSLLRPIEFIGPTPTNRKRLLRFIADKAVSPAEVSDAVLGRWLDDLPIAEVVPVMDYITQGEKWPERTAHVLNLYLHPDKPFPKELIPLGERILQQIESTYNNDHECNHLALGIAKADLEKGFDLLEKQIVAMNKIDLHEWRSVWNPFQRHSANGFWNHLRSQNPERAYRCLCTLTNRHMWNDIFNDAGKSLIDLENHSSTLLKIANENENAAEQIARSTSISQPGFFPFAFAFLSNRLIDGKAAAHLSATVVESFSYGSLMEKEQSALRNVEAQLKDPTIPSHGRVWLGQLKLRIQEAIKNSPWSGGDNEYLGWS